MGETTGIVFVTGGTKFLRTNFITVLLSKLTQESKVFVLTPESAVFEDTRVIDLKGTIEHTDVYSEQLKMAEYVYVLGEDELMKYAGRVDTHKKFSELLADNKVLKNCIVVNEQGRLKEFLGKAGIPITVFKVGEIYGRNMPVRTATSSVVSLVQNKSRLIHGNFDFKISLIHIDDFCAGLVACIGNAKSLNKTYHASAEVLSLGKIFSIAHEHIRGEKPAQVWLPTPKFLQKKVFAVAAINEVEAHAEFYRELLADTKPLLFSDRAIDVIAGHIGVTGYWVLTGANSGIGYELACRLHASGRAVIFIDKETTNLVGFGRDRIIKADLTDPAQLREVIQKILPYRVNVLINNAGIGYRGDFKDADGVGMEKTISVNMNAPIALTHALLPSIIETHGIVINIASSAGYNPLPGMATYAASKAFMLNWSSALWYELKNKCLVITCAPSGTNTNFQKSAGVRDTTTLLTPYYVSSKIFDAIKKGTPFLFLGKKNHIFVYLTRLLPLRLNVILWGKLFKRLR